jgi:DNA-binding transcriptional ArsR family regulator
MSELTYRRQAELLSALAHPVRLQILDILADGEACVCHLSSALHQRQAYVSQQLARLKQAGLIVDTKDGLFVYYNLAHPGITDLLSEARQRLGQMTAGGSQPQPEARPRAAKTCPCPKCQAARIMSRGRAAAAVVAG